mmetsp:Transcript_16428/g.45819  ORF Transcript_16428/g.45819 Transcript_16428/m.45819 type:complete len:86 (-) Transcript_16428:800-1057(-)
MYILSHHSLFHDDDIPLVNDDTITLDDDLVVVVVDPLLLDVVVVFVFAVAAGVNVLSTKKPTNKKRNPLVIFCPQCRNLPGKINA